MDSLVVGAFLAGAAVGVLGVAGVAWVLFLELKLTSADCPAPPKSGDGQGS